MAQARVSFETALKDAMGGPKSPVVAVVGCQAEWGALGAAAEMPGVDFGREVLLVVSPGTRPDGTHVVEIREVLDLSAALGAPAALVLWEERHDGPPTEALCRPIHVVRAPRGRHYLFARG